MSGCDGIWSKVKVTLTILRRKQVLCSPRLGIFVGWEKRRCALDSILVNLNKTISRFRALCLFWPATTAMRCSHFQASHWSTGPSGDLSLAADDMANCDRRWSNYLISIPLTTLPSLSSSCIIISSYLCFRGNFLTWAWYHRPRLCNPDSRGLWEEISGQVTFYPTILFTTSTHNIPGPGWKMISEI